MGFASSFLGISTFFIPLLISFSPLFPSSHAADTLEQGQSLVDGQTLISASKLFELGFFTPGNSSKRYVGVWYYKKSNQTVVWVANRGSPLSDSSGSLTVRWDGNLVVLDSGRKVVWSSNSSTVWSNSTAQLKDTGNFVLSTSNGSGTVLWQSFDHPTNTFIPGMKISLDQKSGRNQLFTSWKSPDDPGIGNYSLGLDPLGSAQLYIWDGRKVRWRSGQWNGQSFIGITRMRPLYLYGFQLKNDGKGTMSFSFTQFNGSLLKFVMDYDGIERTSIFVEETQSWNVIWQQPLTICETYNTCGINGICNNDNSLICSCLKGFEPKNAEEWTNGNWSSGCIRIITLKCQMNSSIGNETIGDGFFKMDGLKLPDFSDWVSTVTDATGCAKTCSDNCSCIAYAYVYGNIGCMTWGRDLVDVSQLSVGGNELFIKLDGSELDAGAESKIWIAVVVVSVLGATILFICFCLWWKCRVQIKGWWKKARKRETPVFDLRSSTEVQLGFSGPREPGEEGNEGNGSELPFFQFEVLEAATNNFNDSNKLGQGGFGHVYKGVLPGGEEIAVKRLSKSSGQGVDEFKNEIILIAKLQHRNLVKLLGCCIEGEEKMLIYEYMPNKSLDSFIFNPTRQPLLDWKKRFSIIEGIARGLLYLHRDSRLRIVHRDLKASNILLDEEMNPKISDFGMARIFGGNQNQANTVRVVGTYGYMSPEYAMEGLFSTKSDVYSFGVLILEIVSGYKNNRFHMENFPSLLKYAWKFWSDDKAMELIDPSMRDSCLVHEVLRCVQIGLLCVQDRSSDRPTMPSVVIMLESETAIQLVPKEPTFVPEGSPSDSRSQNFNGDALSTNGLTISILTGR